MKTLVAMMALVVGLSFGAATFVQADEKATPAAPPAAGKKDEKKVEKKPETKNREEVTIRHEAGARCSLWQSAPALCTLSVQCA